MSENVEASTSRNPKGLHGLYRENCTFTFTFSYMARVTEMKNVIKTWIIWR
jgi:hypothetical protein